MKEKFMKKFIVSLLVLCLFSIQEVSAAVVSNILDGEYQEYINKTGFKILNQNEIESRIVFKYNPSEKAYSDYSSKDMSIKISKKSLMNVESEDELAAIIALEIAKCIRLSEYKYAKSLNKIAPKKYETYADKRAVDMLVKSGYSPLALITILNKTFGQVKTDRFSSTSKISIRLAKIYEYIYLKYPTTLEDRKFTSNIYYQNFLLTSRNNRKILQDRILNNSDGVQMIEYR
jgi:hypothetical protein